MPSGHFNPLRGIDRRRWTSRRTHRACAVWPRHPVAPTTGDLRPPRADETAARPPIRRHEPWARWGPRFF